jgi:hypothetical protein
MAGIVGNISSSAKAGLTNTFWTPVTIASGVSYWDAAVSTLSVSGGLCAQINDLIGTNHLVQATTGQKPTSGADTINSLNALGFDAADDNLAKALTLVQPLTVWAVLKLKAIGTRRDVISGNGGGAIATKLAALPDNWCMFAGNTADSSIATDTSVHLVIYRYNGTSSTVQVDATTSGLLNPSTAGITSPFSLGPQGSGFGADMSLGAAGFTSNIVSTTEATKLRTWAQRIWGTP